MRTIDRLSDLLARVAGWAYFAIGLMLTWEVVGRYFFNAPTIWAEELSRLVFVWATLIAAAALLRHDQHIRVTVLTGKLGPAGRRLARAVSLVFVLGLCALVVRHGTPIAWDSFVRDRSTGTMLDIPNWWSQAAVPLAFLLLGLQGAIELWRTLAGAPLPSHEDVPE